MIDNLIQKEKSELFNFFRSFIQETRKKKEKSCKLDRSSSEQKSGKKKSKKKKKKQETTTGKGVSRQKPRGEERERGVMEVKKFAEEKKQKKREE